MKDKKPLWKSLLLNPFLWIAVFTLSGLLFFDNFNVGRRMRDHREMKELEAEKQWLQEQTEKARQTSDQLFSNDEALERFAREKYFMKKDSEDIYIVEPSQ